MKDKILGWAARVLDSSGTAAPVIFCSFYLFGTVIGNYLTLIGKGSFQGSGRYVRDRP